VSIHKNSPHTMSSKILNSDQVNSIRLRLMIGIKEYSEWPTVPQLYVNGEFVGGCDIVMNMHQSGELEKVLESAGVLVPFEEVEGETSTEGGEVVVGQGTVEEGGKKRDVKKVI
jgi:glutaredoxin